MGGCSPDMSSSKCFMPHRMIKTLEPWPGRPYSDAPEQYIIPDIQVVKVGDEWQILQNEDGDVERVIVQGVDLDHLAVTRAPANPDANAITQLRTAIERSAYEVRAKRMIEHLGNGTRVFTTPAVAERVRDILTERVAEGEADEGFLAVVTDDSGVAMQFGERHVVAVTVYPAADVSALNVSSLGSAVRNALLSVIG